MTKKRHYAASGFFVPPLTIAEVTGKRLKSKGRLITCSICHKSGGTLIMSEETKGKVYNHEKCQVEKIKG